MRPPSRFSLWRPTSAPSSTVHVALPSYRPPRVTQPSSVRPSKIECALVLAACESSEPDVIRASRRGSIVWALFPGVTADAASGGGLYHIRPHVVRGTP